MFGTCRLVSSETPTLLLPELPVLPVLLSTHANSPHPLPFHTFMSLDSHSFPISLSLSRAGSCPFLLSGSGWPLLCLGLTIWECELRSQRWDFDAWVWFLGRFDIWVFDSSSVLGVLRLIWGGFRGDWGLCFCGLLMLLTVICQERVVLEFCLLLSFWWYLGVLRKWDFDQEVDESTEAWRSWSRLCCMERRVLIPCFRFWTDFDFLAYLWGVFGFLGEFNGFDGFWCLRRFGCLFIAFGHMGFDWEGEERERDRCLITDGSGSWSY